MWVLMIDSTPSERVLPPASPSTTVDGYPVTLDGTPMAGMTMQLKVSISKDGEPVTDLQPYLATYAPFGDWRLFPQFSTGGTLRTAAIAVRVG